MPPLPDDFHPFSLLHAFSLLWTLGPLILACRIGRRSLARNRIDTEQTLTHTWAGFIIAINLWSLVYWHVTNFDIQVSLPIQLCDLACLIAPLVFLTHWRWPRTILFFWGIGLSTQAFITPTVEQGPAEVRYYLFWLVHLGIVGTAIYDAVVRRYRPTIRDLLLGIAATVLYTLVMIAVNHFLDANYGFVGNQLRAAPTIIDKLGVWPGRIFTLAAIVITLFCIMWFVANLVDRIAPARPPTRARGLIHCRKCGYDLAEISAKSDHCPECGTPIASPGV